MRSASASTLPGVTVTSCTQATTPNVPTPPKRQPLLGQIYGLTRFLASQQVAPGHHLAGARDLRLKPDILMDPFTLRATCPTIQSSADEGAQSLVRHSSWRPGQREIS